MEQSVSLKEQLNRFLTKDDGIFCLSLTAIKSSTANSSRIANHENSGTVGVECGEVLEEFEGVKLFDELIGVGEGDSVNDGVGEGIRLGESEVSLIVTVCVLLQSLDSPVKL